MVRTEPRLTIDQLNELAKQHEENCRQQEQECEAHTREAIKMSKKAPETLAGTYFCLGYLDAISSCMFGCGGGNHSLERLLFRTCNRTRAALRLAFLGFYDESLMLDRANGETANLLTLFSHKHGSYEEWQAGKWKKPVEVRLALEALDVPFASDRKRYAKLSGLAAHSDPKYAPSAYNPQRRPVAPGHYSYEGILLCINETAIPLAFALLAATHLMTFPADVRKALISAAAHLFRSIGGVTIESLEHNGSSGN